MTRKVALSLRSSKGWTLLFVANLGPGLVGTYFLNFSTLSQPEASYEFLVSLMSEVYSYCILAGRDSKVLKKISKQLETIHNQNNVTTFAITVHSAIFSSDQGKLKL